jgi:hypothetical protein
MFRGPSVGAAEALPLQKMLESLPRGYFFDGNPDLWQEADGLATDAPLSA